MEAYKIVFQPNRSIFNLNLKEKNHKTINLAIIGCGTVGAKFIEQILNQKEEILVRKQLKINIFALANSTNLILNAEGIENDWDEINYQNNRKKYQLKQVIGYAKYHELENLILVDNTANVEVAESYETFIKNGFDIVSSNKIANTLSLEKYHSLRNCLNKYQKRYAYETNVGAGLPLIDTIRLLHLSGENITRIKGVFSGSLSYIFNRFSVNDLPFSEIVLEAVEKGYTEPDPREDLNGNDVARKLLILGRELDFEKELADVEVRNLIPENLREVSKETFFDRIEELDAVYKEIKNNSPENYVLRYVADLQWDIEIQKTTLEVKLEQIRLDSPLGQVKSADSIFEIYTHSYGAHPLVIQGAGAGADVTARGVFGDVLRLS